MLLKCYQHITFAFVINMLDAKFVDSFRGKRGFKFINIFKATFVYSYRFIPFHAFLKQPRSVKTKLVPYKGESDKLHYVVYDVRDNGTFVA